MGRQRYFRTETGWCQDTIGTDAEEFGATMESHEADLSMYYSTPVTGVELSSDDKDPRDSNYVISPDATPSPEELKALAQAEYDAAVDAKLREQAVQALAADGIHPPK